MLERFLAFKNVLSKVQIVVIRLLFTNLIFRLTPKKYYTLFNIHLIYQKDEKLLNLISNTLRANI